MFQQKKKNEEEEEEEEEEVKKGLQNYSQTYLHFKALVKGSKFSNLLFIDLMSYFFFSTEI